MATWAAVSTASATVQRSSEWLTLTIVSTMARLTPPAWSMPSMSDPSIFMVLTAKCWRFSSDDQSDPMSSTVSWMPSREMARRSSAAPWSASVVSVTSMVRRSGCRPECSRAWAAAAAASLRRSWKTEQLTASWISDRHRTAWAHASDSTQPFRAVM